MFDEKIMFAESLFQNKSVNHDSNVLHHNSNFFVSKTE